MESPLTRRRILAGTAAAAALGPAGAAWSAYDALAALEAQVRGRLGVFAVDTGSVRRLAHRADERFVMCSTFKLILAAAVLARIEAGRERLDRRIAYGPPDLLDYAPVTRAHLAEGAMSVEALVAAAMVVSDNTAANLLLASVGGPAAVTAFARRLGDGVTRLDRSEPALNRTDGILDTTSPRAMAGSARAILLGDAVSQASRRRLQGWMVASTPGLGRLRAGLPASWRSGDKSGTGDSEANDVALAWPPARPPLVIAAFYDAPGLDGPGREAVLREVGRIIAAWLR